MTELTLGAISDTHIPMEMPSLPCDLLEVLTGVDAIVHTGDFAIPEVLETLNGLGPRVYGVYGNLDGPQMRLQLPELRTEQFGRFSVGMIHGWGPSTRLAERVRKRFADVDLILYGHSHTPCVETISGALVVNPGSVCHNRDGSRSYALIRLGDEIEIEQKTLTGS